MGGLSKSTVIFRHGVPKPPAHKRPELFAISAHVLDQDFQTGQQLAREIFAHRHDPKHKLRRQFSRNALPPAIFPPTTYHSSQFSMHRNSKNTRSQQVRKSTLKNNKTKQPSIPDALMRLYQYQEDKDPKVVLLDENSSNKHSSAIACFHWLQHRFRKPKSRKP